MGDEKLIVNCCSWDWSSSSLLTSDERLVEMVLGPGQHDDKERRRWEVQLGKPVEGKLTEKNMKKRIGQKKSKEKIKSVIFLWGGVSNWLCPVVFFLSLERNISNFCDEKRDDRHVLVAEYSRMPARLSLVQLIGRDVIAAVTCESSLQKQRLGAVVKS